MNPRFPMEELQELMRAPPIRGADWLEAQMSELLRKGLEKPPPRVPEGAPAVVLTTPTTSAYDAGYLLVEVDREIRRAARILRERPASLTRLPLPEKVRALDLAYAEPGSLRFFLWMYESAAAILLATPVQLAQTLSWLWDHRPGSWDLRRPVPRSVQQIVESTHKAAVQSAEAGSPVRTRIAYARDGSLQVDWQPV
jgi:hypothetical protein